MVVTRPTLAETHADLLERPLFAHLATIRPDGAPQSRVMWFEWDGEFLRFTHTKRRQQFKNLAEEPRIAVSIHDPEDQYRSLEVRGEVADVEDDPSGEFYNRLAERYGSPHRVRDPEVRVVVKVRPTKYIRVTGGAIVGAHPSVA
jgi:PPOX class probable F420-dependent enzyme